MYTKTETYDHRRLAAIQGLPPFFEGVVRSGSRTGTRVPKFREIIKHGGDASSYYSRSWYKIEADPFACKFRSWPQGSPNSAIQHSYSGFPGLNQTFSLHTNTSIDSKALSELHKKLRQYRSEMNGGVFLGELRETLAMLRRPASALRDAASRYARDVDRLYRRNPKLLNSKNRQNALSAMSGLWLEFQFGAKPFISDVQSIAQTVGRIVVDGGRRAGRVTGRSASDNLDEIVRLPNQQCSVEAASRESAPRAAVADIDRRKSSTRQVRYLALVDSSVRGPTEGIQYLASVSGLTFENIGPTIYELVPYSFLLDYFSNLGDVVEGLWTDRTGIRRVVRTTAATSTVEVISTMTPAGVAARCNVQLRDCSNIFIKNGRYQEQQLSVLREPLASLPTPNLEFSFPSSGLKIGNMLALFEAKLSPHGGNIRGRL